MSDECVHATGRPRGSGAGTSSHPRVTCSLVLWSGGLDSTYVLLRLLEGTPDRVYSHHVLVSRGGGSDQGARRGAFEAEAIGRLRGRVAARARDFVHTHSRVDLGPAPARADGGAALLGFMGAQAAIAHGFTPFDRVLVGVNADEDPGWALDSAACALRRARLCRALRAAWGCDEVPQIYLWEPRPAKAEMASYLGRALLPATVSCLRPVEAGRGDLRPCGRCRKCRTRADWDRTPPLTAPDGPGEAERTQPPFHRLSRAQSRTPAPEGAGAANGPPVS